MTTSDGDALTGADSDGDDGRDEHSAGAEKDAWVVRVVDGLGPLDDADREVLGRLLNQRSR